MRLSVLMSLRTQLDAVQISIDGLIAEEQQRQEEDARPRGCQHKNKTDLRTMGEREHWRCRECGVVHKDSLTDGTVISTT